MVVLNETKWVEVMLKDKSLGKKPFETLSRVARYYLDAGLTKKEARSSIENFLILCDPSASVLKWDKTISAALLRASKSKAVNADKIYITGKETEKIKTLSSKQLQRLAFTLLCIAKYWKEVNPEFDGWVFNRDSEIMSMANINTSIKRQGLLYHALKEAGFIRFSKKIDNTSVKVCFIEDGSPILEIRSFKNLGYQYLKFLGEPCFECQKCGAIVKIRYETGRRPKYCKECAIKIKTKQNTDQSMKS